MTLILANHIIKNMKIMITIYYMTSKNARALLRVLFSDGMWYTYLALRGVSTCFLISRVLPIFMYNDDWHILCSTLADYLCHFAWMILIYSEYILGWFQLG